MIVGTKIERYFTASRELGQPWDLVSHEVRTELHATKGWRRVSHRRKQTSVRSLPGIAVWRASNTTTFKRNYNRASRGVDSIPITEAMLMRHGWYRRKLRKEAEQREAA